jgi:hypothetical protein
MNKDRQAIPRGRAQRLTAPAAIRNLLIPVVPTVGARTVVRCALEPTANTTKTAPN